nr:PREDICTED: protein-glutamine gamma-glutamyltransferase E [Anolis carolinensis]|eukprot:XP_003230298.2 PREDICTED: protein-glutamine gamma-glutamyltransferase E [Anolis carolinensis]
MAELTPTYMNWHGSSNGQAHRTSRFSASEPVFRRGQAFHITVYMSQATQGGEAFSFVAETGQSPSESQGTRASFSASGVGGSWGASLEGREGNQLTFSLTSPASAPIGRWKLSLRVGQGDARLLGQFVLLFNPWCSADLVYLGDEDERQEYVLNENGIIFVGNAKYIEARGWFYGQFQKSILDLCLLLMDLSLYHRKDPGGDSSRRGDPRYVARVVSSMVNGNDNDNGVLEGKWSEEFAHHENPSRWDGSVAILWKWAKDRYRPVQYGQCWVFAGVAATALRCLGIPTRLVTNFNSAHDSDHNLAIDKYYDPSGKSLKIGQDSVWDYHVWNEGWFVRGDLGGSYSGWQVIDATPQERSQGLYQCGPASVMAVKQGQVRLNYDTAFVYSEVNADINCWVVYPNGTRKRGHSDTTSIGVNMSTKAVGSSARVDVTGNYKFPEGSSEERAVNRRALAELSGSHAAEEEVAEEASSRAGATAEEGVPDTSPPSPASPSSDLISQPGLFGRFRLARPPVLGGDVALVLSLANLREEPTDVTVNLSVATALYTRRTVREVLKEATTFRLQGKEERQLPLRITYGHYGAALTDDRKLLVTALCDVPGGVKLLVEKAITLEGPDIRIKVPHRVVASVPTTVEIGYGNPLPVSVDQCVLLVTLMGHAVKINVAALSPGEQSSIFFEFTPRSSGAMQLHVDFSCDRFQHVKAFTLMDVAEA